MINSIFSNLRLFIIVIFTSVVIGIVLELVTKDLTKYEIHSTKVEFFFDPKLYVYLSTFDIYDSELDQLVGFLSNRNLTNISNSSETQVPSMIISKDSLSDVFYEKYSKSKILIHSDNYNYNKNQILGGSFTFKSRVKNIDNEISNIIDLLNRKMVNLSMNNFKLRKDIYLSKEEQTEKYFLKQINRVQADSLLGEYKEPYDNINKKQLIEIAYQEKLNRIEESLDYALSKNYKSPLLSQINTSDDFMYLLGSDVLKSMVDEFKNNKDFYISNPKFLYNNLIPEYSDIINVFNKLKNDFYLKEFLFFYKEAFQFLENDALLVSYNITSKETKIFDTFKNLKLPGTITIIFTALSILLLVSYLGFKKKD